MSSSVTESASMEKEELEFELTRKTLNCEEVVKIHRSLNTQSKEQSDTVEKKEELPGRKREHEEASGDAIQSPKIHTIKERRQSIEAGHSVDPDCKTPLKDLKAGSKGYVENTNS